MTTKSLTLFSQKYGNIDVECLGKKSRFKNTKDWVLFVNGNNESYEEQRDSNLVHGLITSLQTNAILFNYPAVGRSNGIRFPNREASISACSDIIKYVHTEKGLAATSLTIYAHSIGGGMVAECLSSLSEEERDRTVFVISRSFSSLAAAATGYLCSLAGAIVEMSGWDLKSKEALLNFKGRTIILQTANTESAEELENEEKIIHDGIVSKEAALATALFQHGPLQPNIMVIGIPESHNEPLSFETESFLSEKIQELHQSIIPETAS